MITEEYVQLISKLAEKTKSGEVNWKPTSDETQFIVYFDKFSMSISRIGNYNEEFIRFAIRNDTGYEIDSFNIDDSDQNWKEVDELFSIARRKAYNIDKAIYSIITELGSAGQVGEEKPPELKDVPF